MNVLILGTRGIPARHGGFETFAEQLAHFLVERGHSVAVYCQSNTEPPFAEDTWQGITRIHLFGGEGPTGTVAFDYRCVRDAMKRPGIILTLGYNTAVFSLFYKLGRRTSVMNMDGIEWRRDKWSFAERVWLRLNEVAGALLSTHLIADHPMIAEHLRSLVPALKITMIPYGADTFQLDEEQSNAESILESLGLQPRQYALVVARPEPENSLLEIVTAFSCRPRPVMLVVLGNYDPAQNPYQATVLAAASSQVIFPGAIYDPRQLTALRCHALLYLHGHRVGGTNPSLIEALAAHNAVLAQNNPFNRWVAGPGSEYFHGTADLSALLDSILDDPERLTRMAHASHARHDEAFLQLPILESYERLLLRLSGPPKS